ncbi:kinase-like protein [Aulographum hederae CBS 113979]|uniref:non-specific serine/threonine protein kinase n=1 Tax=Aulographum hederae CBS 113979 TaxID=1176131 RepID=A0A6G1H9G3_9PEZI|nr:kinase-like protein [Aulographum hederae CBS 113979]
MESQRFLDPTAAGGGHKYRQIQDAHNMQRAVAERASREKKDPPPYEFLELIGKGTYGRVYKSTNTETNKVVAVKIIEVDKPDYQADLEGKDDSIPSFHKETNILRQLRDSKAKNVNQFYDAFEFHSQLWIVTEYCPGGSVKTLMKASTIPNQLEEAYIITVARELAVALQAVHAIGIVHRDIKCANILIREDGLLQLCDFGVAATLESQFSKRSTIIGTPHYMPLELVSRLDQMGSGITYGTEVDCWAFGIAVYEMATGNPPNAHIRPQQLGNALRAPPRLEGGSYSQGLRDFISFCLAEDPTNRPSASQILDHPYIANSSEQHPTEDLAVLVQRYAGWERSGGQRASLFQPFGAELPETLQRAADDDEWNFSTTLEFDRRFAEDNPLLDPLYSNNNFLSEHGADQTPTTSGPQEISRFDLFVEEQRIQRGEKAMQRLFDPNAKPYKYGELERRISDLPLRNMGTGSAGDRTTMIDLDDVHTTIPSIDLGSMSTLRAKRFNGFSYDDDEDEQDLAFSDNRYSKRATKDWTFPMQTAPPDNPNRRTQDWTFPKMDAGGRDSVSHQTSRRMPDLAVPPAAGNRRTQDWKFPTFDELETRHSRDMSEQFSRPAPSMPGAGFRPMLKHAATTGDLSNMVPYPRSASPDRGSLIDLDVALQPSHDFSRPGTSMSMVGSETTEMTNDDPFALEDQLQTLKLSNQGSNRLSMHMKSQSEPSAQISEPPADTEEREYGSDHGPSHPRSASQLSNHSNRSSSRRQTGRPWGKKGETSGLQRRWANNSFELGSEGEYDASESDLDSHRAEGRLHSLPSNSIDLDSMPRLHSGPLPRFYCDLPEPHQLNPDVLRLDADPELMVRELQDLSRSFFNHVRVMRQVYAVGDETQNYEPFESTAGGSAATRDYGQRETAGEAE